jgi:hypothetical protein
MEARVTARHREVVTMHRHIQAQEGHVELNSGGHIIQTSDRLRRCGAFPRLSAMPTSADCMHRTSVEKAASLWAESASTSATYILIDGVVTVAEVGVNPCPHNVSNLMEISLLLLMILLICHQS